MREMTVFTGANHKIREVRYLAVQTLEGQDIQNPEVNAPLGFLMPVLTPEQQGPI
jgi:hypothetical protein